MTRRPPRIPSPGSLGLLLARLGLGDACTIAGGFQVPETFRLRGLLTVPFLDGVLLVIAGIVITISAYDAYLRS